MIKRSLAVLRLHHIKARLCIHQQGTLPAESSDLCHLRVRGFIALLSETVLEESHAFARHGRIFSEASLMSSNEEAIKSCQSPCRPLDTDHPTKKPGRSWLGSLCVVQRNPRRGKMILQSEHWQYPAEDSQSERTRQRIV